MVSGESFAAASLEPKLDWTGTGLDVDMLACDVDVLEEAGTKGTVSTSGKVLFALESEFKFELTDSSAGEGSASARTTGGDISSTILLKTCRNPDPLGVAAS